MAEGFEPYHVPQQSRRDKLRIVAQNHLESSIHGFLPLYDSSLISPDDQYLTNHVKEERAAAAAAAANFMGFLNSGGIVQTSTPQQHQHHPFNLDPPHPINPNNNNNNNSSSIHDNPFLYNYEHAANAFSNGTVLFKPEPQGHVLSLSLSSHDHNTNQLPLELNLQRYNSTGGGYNIVPSINVTSASTSTNDVSRTSIGPMGPFTGYASILKGSKFLKPAQQLLEELCDVGYGFYGEKALRDSSLADLPIDDFAGVGDDHGGGEVRKKKSRLISLLDEVFRRYKQYFEQMQTVVASFEYVAGLGNAAPYANFALKAMSKQFRCLKNAITDQLQFTGKAHGQVSYGKDDAPRFGHNDRSFYGQQRQIHSSGFIDNQPVWRPQRGLPERAVSVLRSWLFDHFLHPYPTDTDKLMLAKQTGLSRSQVSNWFINARVRLWKPMVEEIHMLETRQSQKSVQREERISNKSSNDPLPPPNSLAPGNPSSSTQKVQVDDPSKCSRNEHSVTVGSSELPNFPYHNLSNHQHVGVSMAGASSGVSLTLGLHQNNRSNLSEPFQGSQRFGHSLGTSNEGYVMNGFDGQNRHFGGQLLHDFVG
ncbi:hypothetical protein ACFE04_000857 [Oxalis oulophora]